MKKQFTLAIALVATITAASLLDGCGSMQKKASETAPMPGNIQHSLPASLQAKLSSPQSRLRTVSQLPAASTVIGQTAKNVLYIAPSEQYAIAQFRAVWDKLPSIPTVVVWTGTTEAIAKATWEKEGYQGDPLPTDNTLYAAQDLPTPDSYHHKGNGWQEEPGIAPDKDLSSWITFFGR